MIVEVISTGTELLLGEIINTNFPFLAEELNQRGFDVLYETTVGDNPKRLKEVLEHAASRADLIITSGGLGPTRGDLTKELVAAYCGLDSYLDMEVWSHINDFFATRKMCMAHNNEKQAMIPYGAHILKNAIGTAPGLVIEQAGKLFILLPGPPVELKDMCQKQLFPFLNKKFADLGLIKSHTLKLRGLGESAVAEKLDELIIHQTNPTLAIYARNGDILIRITAKAPSETEAEKLIFDKRQAVENLVGKYVYGYDDDTLPACLGRELIKQNKTIAFAESCTGGLTTSLMTDVPGSSAYIKGSVVTYSNEAKHQLIGVKNSSLKKYGAVSQEVACEMAQGVRQLLQTDYGVSITGIAGPGGGTRTKPVGLVYLAVADQEGVVWAEKHFNGGREQNKLRSALNALGMAFDRLTVINNNLEDK